LETTLKFMYNCRRDLLWRTPLQFGTKCNTMLPVNIIALFNCQITQLANSMELSSSWEAASHLATQDYSKHFMEPEGSLPCSQEPSNVPYPQPDHSSPYHPVLPLCFNTILPPTSRSFQWSLSFWLSHQNPIRVPLRPHSC
jgi:hypothetical protein